MTDGGIITATFWIESYGNAHHLFIFSLMMPLSYVESTRKKYLFGLLGVLALTLLNVIMYFLATGGLEIKVPITSVIYDVPYYQVVIIGILVLSVLSVFLSYKKSVQLTMYK